MRFFNPHTGRETADFPENMTRHVLELGMKPLDSATPDVAAPEPEAVPASPTCIAIKGDGTRCTAKPKDGTEYCGRHTPADEQPSPADPSPDDNPDEGETEAPEE